MRNVLTLCSAHWVGFSLLLPTLVSCGGSSSSSAILPQVDADPTAVVLDEGAVKPDPSLDSTSLLSASGAVRIMAANITSGNQQSYDPGHGTRIFQGLDPDIILIQEFNYSNNSSGAISTWVSSTFGSGFQYFRESGAQIPNGVISRYPILEAGEWQDSYVSNRDHAWARIDVPGPIDLWAVSVHWLTNDSMRDEQATELLGYINANVPSGDYLVVGGDFNTDNRPSYELNILGAVVDTSASPVDQAGVEGTNASRAKPYDAVYVDDQLEALEVPVVVGPNTFPSGLVFDSRVFTPLSAVSPVQFGDSGSTNMQHMAVIRDFDFGGSGNPTPTPAPTVTPAPGGNTLSNGQTLTDSVARGAWDHFYLDVPAGVSEIEFKLEADGSGDADIYVQKGSQPSSSAYDFRPYLYGSNETVIVNAGTNPTASGGRWYVSVNGYSAASYRLTASYSASSPTPTPIPTPQSQVLLDTNGSVNQGSWKNYTVNVPSGSSQLTIEMTGTGDGDLYVRHGSAYPTLSTWDFRPYLWGSNETVVISSSSSPSLKTGQYWISIYGYEASTFNVTATLD